ncbi:hypothetical protein HZA33_05055 [Candidatus Pacearchaeota archaeon]|nr:hypothetical protein [Candidatus Pacearchaeota archaeon]
MEDKKTQLQKLYEEERDPLYLILIEKDTSFVEVRRIHVASSSIFSDGKKYSLSDNEDINTLFEYIGEQVTFFGAYSKLSIFYNGNGIEKLLEQRNKKKIEGYEAKPLPSKLQLVLEGVLATKDSTPS